MKPAAARGSLARASRRLIEQLGAAGTEWGVAHSNDVLGKVLPGAMARLRVARENRGDGLWNAHPFVEQLGVPSGSGGVRHATDLGRAAFGLMARWSVARHSGMDYRARGYELIERWALQAPLDAKPKAFMLSVLYAVAAKLPDTR
jgi:hypothetical protein